MKNYLIAGFETEKEAMNFAGSYTIIEAISKDELLKDNPWINSGLSKEQYL